MGKSHSSYLPSYQCVSLLDSLECQTASEYDNRNDCTQNTTSACRGIHSGRGSSVHVHTGEALRLSKRWRSQSYQAVATSFRFPDYHLLNHITLKHGDGSTQIDHILLSRFGVFVIETKAHKGWLFASVDQRSWTQVLFGEKFKFRNPIKQNQLHVRVVRELLDFLPADAIRSAVVFAGTSEFKTKQPDGVFDIDQLIDHIRSFREEVISLNRMQFCVGRIETARYAITKETDIDHVDSLRSRYGITDR